MPKNPITAQDVVMVNVNILVPIHPALNPSLVDLSPDEVANEISDFLQKSILVFDPKNDIFIDFDWATSTSKFSDPTEMSWGEGQLQEWNQIIENIESEGE